MKNRSYAYFDGEGAKALKILGWGGGSKTPGAKNRENSRCLKFLTHVMKRKEYAVVNHTYDSFKGLEQETFGFDRHFFGNINLDDPALMSEKIMLREIRYPNFHPDENYERECPVFVYTGHGWSWDDGTNSNLQAEPLDPSIQVTEENAEQIADTMVVTEDEVRALWKGEAHWWGGDLDLGYKLVILNSCRSAGLQPQSFQTRHDFPYLTATNVNSISISGVTYTQSTEALELWGKAFQTDILIAWTNSVNYGHVKHFSDVLIEGLNVELSFVQIFYNAHLKVHTETIPEEYTDAEGLLWQYHYILEKQWFAEPKLWGEPGPGGGWGVVGDVPCFLYD